MPESILFLFGCGISALVTWALVEVGKLERQRAQGERAERQARRGRKRWRTSRMFRRAQEQSV